MLFAHRRPRLEMPKYPDAHLTYNSRSRPQKVECRPDNGGAPRMRLDSKPHSTHLCQMRAGAERLKLDQTSQTRMRRSMRTKKRTARRATIYTKRSNILALVTKTDAAACCRCCHKNSIISSKRRALCGSSCLFSNKPESYQFTAQE